MYDKETEPCSAEAKCDFRSFRAVESFWTKPPLSGKGFMFENWGTWPNYMEKYSRIIANLLYSNEIQIFWEFFSKIHQMALAIV